MKELDEISVSLKLDEKVFGFSDKASIEKVMKACEKYTKDPKHLTLPTKFRVIGYTFRTNRGYPSVEFNIAPIDSFALDDLLK